MRVQRARPDWTLMSELAQFPPDITLAVDGDGVIRTAMSADALADESIDLWRGMRWADTVPPEAAAQVAKAVELARQEGESSCFTVNQRLPSGRQLLLEYTTVKLGRKSGFVAIGKNVQDVSDLKSRLSLVQKEREQDYWKLREVETRYRALLDASSEAVALVRVDNLRVVEANLVAAKSLGLVPGAEFMPDLTDGDKKALAGLLETARMNGRAPRHRRPPPGGRTLSLRASMLASEAGTFYLFQMATLDEAGVTAHVAGPEVSPVLARNFRLASARRLRHPRPGRSHSIRQPDFPRYGSGGLGERGRGKNAKIWFNRPGTGLRVILNLVEQHGAVRSLRTTLESELGMHSGVEISAVGDQIDRPRFFGLIVRDVMPNGRQSETVSASGFPEIGGVATSLETAVRSSVEAVERQRLVDALAQFAGNRTVAAKSLGISRQSLYTKLKKYGLDRH